MIINGECEDGYRRAMTQQYLRRTRYLHHFMHIVEDANAVIHNIINAGNRV